MTDKKTLNDYTNEDLERIIDERLAKRMKEQLGPVLSDILKLNEQIDAATKIIEVIKTWQEETLEAAKNHRLTLAVKDIADAVNAILKFKQDFSQKMETRRNGPAPPSTIDVGTGWKRMSNDKGDWTYTDKLPRDLVERVHAKDKHRSTEGDYTYSLYGDPNSAGYPKFVSRYKATRR